MTDPVGGNDRATLRDVFDAVNETRAEIHERIDTLGGKFDAFVTSNEHRLTVLETHQGEHSKQLTSLMNRLNEHGRDIGGIKDKQREDEAAQRALENSKSSAWQRHSATIGWTISGVIAIGAILALVLHP